MNTRFKTGSLKPKFVAAASPSLKGNRQNVRSFPDLTNEDTITDYFSKKRDLQLMKTYAKRSLPARPTEEVATSLYLESPHKTDAENALITKLCGNASKNKVVFVQRIEKNSLNNQAISTGPSMGKSVKVIREPPAMSKLEKIGCAACLFVCESQSALTVHVSKLHASGDKVVSLFFSDVEGTEFTHWKQSLECGEASKYLSYDGTKISRKALLSNASNIYTCNAKAHAHPTPLRSPSPRVTYYCPSRINVQLYATGVHVLYYKSHHGHPSRPYRIPGWCEKFVTSNLIRTQWHNKFLESPEVSVLTKFNILMNAIANDVEKVPEETLRVLHGKAIEMLLLINRPKVNEEDTTRECLGDGAMAGDDLEKEIREMNKSRAFMPKLQKQRVVMPKPLKYAHAFSINDIEMELKEEVDDDVRGEYVESVEIKDEVVIEEHDLLGDLLSKRNSAKKPMTEDLEDVILSKRKTAPHTAAPKQQTPKTAAPKPQTPKTAAPKPQTLKTAAPKPQTPNTATPQTQKEAQTPETQKAWLNNSPSSFNDTYKSFIEQSIQEKACGKGSRIDQCAKRKHTQPKQKIKTKLGFQPLHQKRKAEKNKSLEVDASPITEPMRKISRNSSVGSENGVKVKVEQYEVMEQENDCNILILKF